MGVTILLPERDHVVTTVTKGLTGNRRPISEILYRELTKKEEVSERPGTSRETQTSNVEGELWSSKVKRYLQESVEGNYSRDKDAVNDDLRGRSSQWRKALRKDCRVVERKGIVSVPLRTLGRQDSRRELRPNIN